MNFHKQLRASSCSGGFMNARQFSFLASLQTNHGAFQQGCWISLCFLVEIPAGNLALIRTAFCSFPRHWRWLELNCIEHDWLLCMSSKDMSSELLEKCLGVFWGGFFWYKKKAHLTRQKGSKYTNECESKRERKKWQVKLEWGDMTTVYVSKRRWEVLPFMEWR